MQARRRGGSRGSNEPLLEVNNGGLKTQTVDFQLLANSGGMETNFECCSFLITLQENAKSIGKVLNCSMRRLNNYMR